MKKILLGCLLIISGNAFANGPHGHYGHRGHHYHGGHNNWAAPLIIGGIVGYTIKGPPVVYAPPPVMYPPINSIPTVQTQTCTPWIEIYNSDGSITRTRTCSQ